MSSRWKDTESGNRPSSSASSLKEEAFTPKPYDYCLSVKP